MCPTREERGPFIQHEEICLFSSNPSFHLPPSSLLLESIWTPFSASTPLSITHKYNKISLSPWQDERLFAPNCTQPSQRRKRWGDREWRGRKRSVEEKRKGRGVKAGEKKGWNERCVCSVPQADTSLLSLAQPNHMPPGLQGGGRRERWGVSVWGGAYNMSEQDAGNRKKRHMPCVL